MISTIVVNYNQGDKLEHCLQSVRDFTDEILVIDLYSSDQSKKVAEKFNAIFIQQKKVPYVELIRNFAVSKANGDWVLVLDPDEMITLQLAERFKKISRDEEFDAVNTPRKNIFFGRWIKHTNWWPDRHVRFFKKGNVKWSDNIHNYPKVDGKILNLEAKENLAIIHYGYKSISEFIDRQNRYSNIEAENLYTGGEKFSWVIFFWKPIREFLVRFIKHAGFLDGFYGFTLSFLMMVYQMEVMVKLWERERSK